MADRFLVAAKDGGRVFACVSEGCKFVIPDLGATRLAAALRPYRDEQSARTALAAAGYREVEWEGRR